MGLRSSVATAVVLALVTAACGDDDGASTDGPPLVVASFHPLADAARQVGGDRVDVRDLTPVGAEPHDVELTSRQVDLVEDAHLVVILGGRFQPAVEDAVRRRDGPTLVLLDELGIDTRGDPHVWLDPGVMSDIVGLVADALVAADPADAGTYRERAGDHRSRLAELDGRFERTLATCEQRTIVVPHEAFGWLAARYDLEQVGLAGTDPHGEPDPRRLGRVADLIEARGITTVFRDPADVDEAVRTVADETGTDVAVLDPLEQARRVSGVDGYVERMDANLTALAGALGCERAA
jgi:zinc transport system substrate-binding protein